MTVLWFPEYQLAAGNNNAAGLTAIETILAGYGTIQNSFPAVPPAAWGRYSKSNVASVRPNGRLFFRGFPSADWPLGFILWAQIEGLRTNYCGGGYSGLVTLRTRTDTHDTYSNFNGVLTLKQLADYPANQVRSTGIQDYVLTFSRMVAL